MDCPADRALIGSLLPPAIMNRTILPMRLQQTAFALGMFVCGPFTQAAVDYIDSSSISPPPTPVPVSKTAVHPAYSTTVSDTRYVAVEPQKLAGQPLGSYAARAGGGVDVIWTYGGFKKEDTGLTGNYQAFAMNLQATGNQWAFWGARVEGGVDYLYFDPAVSKYLKFDSACLGDGIYAALSPSKSGPGPLSAFGARAEGGIDFLYYNEGTRQTVRQTTGLAGRYRALAFTDDAAAGNDPPGNWAARVDGGLDYFYLEGGEAKLLPLSANLADTQYVALEAVKQSGWRAGVYAARADGGIDVILLEGDGSAGNPHRAAKQNTAQILPDASFGALAWNASDQAYPQTHGDFWAVEAPRPPARQIGNWPGVATGGDILNPALSLRLGVSESTAAIDELSWDTEGGNRAKMNLLRAPVHVRIPSGGQGVRMGKSQASIAKTEATYSGSVLTWKVRTLANGFDIELRNNNAAGAVDAEVVFPFDPRATPTSIIANDWDAQDRFALPAILFAPDFGGFVVTCEGGNVTGTLIGSRFGVKKADMGFSVTGNKTGEPVLLKFRQHVLPPPDGVAPSEWAKVRRSWLNMFNVSSEWKRADGSRGAPAGILSNNVISDPVSSLMYCYSQPARLVPELAPGVSAAPLLRRTLDFWLTQEMRPDGYIAYVPGGIMGAMMDSNAAILGSAGDYYAMTGDKEWLAARIELLEKAADYLAGRDTNGDGLVESEQSGNLGTKSFGDTYMDTISSGGINALCNALIYRGWKSLAAMETALGRSEQAARYAALADKLKTAYIPTLKTPAGWIGWWKSTDGELNDYSPMMVNCIAVETGVVSPAEGKPMLNKLWKKLAEVGFTVFEVGLPNNLVPVRRDHQYATFGGTKEDGSDTFPHYCNGGVFLEDAIRGIIAYNIVGEPDKAATIFDAMMARHIRGKFANGSGFNAGVTNEPNTGPSISDWKGEPTEYEGFIPKDYTFLTGLLLRDPAWRNKLGLPN